MASFVEYAQTNQGENYTSRSRGTDAARPNQAFGTLFEGLGSVVKGVTTAVDEKNQSDIDTALRTGVDAIRGAQGVDAAVNNPDLFATTPDGSGTGVTVGGATASPTASPPPSVEAATGEVARFTQAFKDGKISDTQYYAKVESLARQVRAKYPGYREIIDQKISSIVGTNPANQLRKEILSEIGTAQAAARKKADSFETFFNSNLEHIPEGLRRRVLSGEKSPTLDYEVRDAVGKSQVKDQTNKSLTSDLALKKARGEAIADDVNKAAVKISSDTVTKIINNGLSTVEGSGPGAVSLQSKINNFLTTNTRPTAEQQQQLAGQSNQLLLNAQLAIDKQLNTPFNKEGDTIASVSTPDKIRQIRDQALQPIISMRDALINGDIGLFAQNANYAKAAQSQDLANLLQRSSSYRTLVLAKEALGPAMGVLLSTNPGLLKGALDDIGKVHSQLTFNELVVGTNNGVTTSFKEQIQRALDNTEKGSASQRATIVAQVNTAYGVLTAKETPPAARASAANMLFQPNSNFMDKFKGESPQQIFAKFTSPEVFNQMKALRSVDPKTWENYKAWAASTFTGMATQSFGDIRELAGPNSNYEVKPGPDGRLVASRKPGAFDPSAPTIPGAQPVGDPVLKRLERAVVTANTGINAVSQVLKEEGTDPNTFLGPFLTNQGIALPTPTEGGSKPATRPLGLTGSVGGEGSDAIDTTTEDTARGVPAEEQIQLTESDDDAIDLNAQSARRDRALRRGLQSDPNWQQGGGTIVAGANAANALRAAAAELGATPEDLATVISYETGGTFDPSIRGGAGNRHIGLIQFGQNEQIAYGASQNQSFPEQMRAVVRYLKHRGFRPGMDILDLYSTINAGSPGRYNASDVAAGGAPGTVRDKVNNQMGRHREKARRLLAD